MSIQQNLPSYTKIFNTEEIKQGDDSRSVLSPAAYFVDLMLLKENEIDVDAAESIDQRRADLGAIPLDYENTYSELPYLDIVNEVMANRIHKETGSNAFDALKTAQYPFPAPFDIDNHELHHIFSYLGTNLTEFYKMFTATPDMNVIAKTYLGITDAVYQQLITADTTDASLRARYGLAAEQNPVEVLSDLTEFMKRTGLSEAQVKELLFQNLSTKEIAAGEGVGFFVNKADIMHINGTTKLDEYLLYAEAFAGIYKRFTGNAPTSVPDMLVLLPEDNIVLTDLYDLKALAGEHGLTPHAKYAMSDSEIADWASYGLTKQELRIRFHSRKQILDISNETLSTSDLNGYSKRLEIAYELQNKELKRDELFSERLKNILMELYAEDVEKESVPLVLYDPKEDVAPQNDSEVDDIINEYDLYNTGRIEGYDLLVFGEADAWKSGSFTLTEIRRKCYVRDLLTKKVNEYSLNITSSEELQLLGLALEGVYDFQYQYLKIKNNDTVVVNEKIDEKITNEHLDRIYRFLLLNRVTGWSFAECDWVLRTTCLSDISDAAIVFIAVLKLFQNQFKLPVEQLCIWVGSIKNWGQGITSSPEHLMYQLFDKHYDIPLLEELELSINNTSIKKRVQGGLGISESEFDLLISENGNRFFKDDVDKKVNLTNLSAMYRYVKLAQINALSIQDLLTILSIIDSQVELPFELFIQMPKPVPYINSGVVLGNPAVVTPDNTLWLIHNVEKLSNWIKELGLSVGEFSFVISKTVDSITEKMLTSDERNALVQKIREEIKPKVITVEMITSDLINEESATSICTALKDEANNCLTNAGLVRHIPVDTVLESIIEGVTDIEWQDDLSGTAGTSVTEWIDATDDQNMNATIEYDTSGSSAKVIKTPGTTWGKVQTPIRSFDPCQYPIVSVKVNEVTSSTTWKLIARQGEEYWIIQDSNNQTGEFFYNYQEITRLTGAGQQILFEIAIESTDPDQYIVIDNFKIFDAKVSGANSVVTDKLADAVGELKEKLTNHIETQENEFELQADYITAIFENAYDVKRTEIKAISDKIFDAIYQTTIKSFTNLLIPMFSDADIETKQLEKNFDLLEQLLAVIKSLGLTSDQIDCYFAGEQLTKRSLGIIYNELRDLQSIKQLTNTFSNKEYSMFKFLDEQNKDLNLLCLATKWDHEQVSVLTSAPFGNPNFSINNLSHLAELHNKLNYITMMGSTAATLGGEVWYKIFGINEVNKANNILLDSLKAKTGSVEWEVKAQQLHNQMNLAKRNAMLSYLLHILEGVNNTRDLYAELLLDVEMGDVATISRIKEAISATQLYYHRTVNNLETWEASKEKLDNLKRWWGWMKNYRVWEANRKVFLYPENYIRPELRNDKSREFKNLEQELLQSEITDESVQQAYKKYLDGYAEVSNLVIAGGSVFKKEDGTHAVMFGHTRTEPKKYYYRMGKVWNDLQNPIDWEPWIPTEVNILSDQVYPVYAFNRLFVFWREIRETNKATYKIEEGKSPVSDNRAYYPVINYSFYNLNKEWGAPQEMLDVGKTFGVGSDWKEESITSAKLRIVNNSLKDNYDSDEYVYVRYTGNNFNIFGRLTPELNYEHLNIGEADEVLALNPTSELPIQLASEPKSFTQWQSNFENTLSAPWFSFDTKGGSFLCKPTISPVISESDIGIGSPFAGISFVETAFNESNGKTCVLHGENYSIYDTNKVLESTAPTVNRFGNINLFYNTGEGVENAFAFEGSLYFVTNNNYIAYHTPNYDHYNELKYANELSLSFGDFTELSNDQFGAVLIIDNAFIYNGYVYIFQSRYYTKYLVTDVATEAGFADIDAVFQKDNILYVTSGNEFVRFDRIPVKKYGRLLSGPQSIQSSSDGIWGDKIDNIKAAFSDANGYYYFLTTEKFVGPYKNPNDDDCLKEMYLKWGKSEIEVYQDGVDAIVELGGKTYAFEGEYYHVYAEENSVLVKQYTKPIKGNWSNLPGCFNNHIDGAYYFGQDLYLSHIDYKGQSTYVGYPIGEPEKWPTELENNQYEIIRLTSNTTQKISQKLLASGVSGVLEVETQEEGELPKFEPYTGTAPLVQDLDTIYYESSNIAVVPNDGELDYRCANSNYYWEIFFHIPYLIAQTLNTAQKHDLAQDWYHYIYDPTERTTSVAVTYTSELASQIALVGYSEKYEYLDTKGRLAITGSMTTEEKAALDLCFDNSPNKTNDLAAISKLQDNSNNYYFWKFYPFYENTDDEKTTAQYDRYFNNPFDPHAIAELRPLAYRKSVVMSYIDNLLDWGDKLFTQYTHESINEARMLYVLAYDLLGDRPRIIEGETTLPTQNYHQLYTEVFPDNWDETLQQLESSPMSENMVDMVTSTASTYNDDFVARGYFEIPENDLFIKYWDRVEDRLYKIRHSMTIEGVKSSLSLFQPSMDPMAIVQAVSAAGGDLTKAVEGAAIETPHYRFINILSKTREFTGQVIQLGQNMLSALEKKDAEEMSLLRNTQENSILNSTLKVKEEQIDNAVKSFEALESSLKNATTRQSHYAELIANGYSEHEKNQLEMLKYSQVFSQIANVFNTVASGASYMPNVGSPFAMTYGGIQIGKAVHCMGSAFSAISGMYSYQSNLSSIIGGWDRRTHDWKLQEKLAANDMDHISKQIEAAKVQVVVTEKEKDVQVEQIKNNQEIDEFLKSKFTNKELYQWMIEQISSIYNMTYRMAIDMARMAQKAFRYELGLKESDVDFIKPPYLDSLYKGLLAGEQLQRDLDKMEMAYLDKNKRRFEISKTVSLADLDPMALIKLKKDGNCSFELTERLYDMDFPGHYCRQIKTVSVSFPAIVGKYENLNATLTQVTDRMLMETDQAGVTYLLNPVDNAPESVRQNWKPNQQIALSRGENDAGLFQLNYHDERYLPFEGTGAVSDWTLELNGCLGAIDWSQIQDVIINVEYTALQGGQAFADQVETLIKNDTSDNSVGGGLILLKQAFNDKWNQFMQIPGTGMTFTIDPEYCPNISGTQITSVYMQYDLPEDATVDLTSIEMNLVSESKTYELSNAGDPTDTTKDNLGNASVLNVGNLIEWKLTPASASDDFNPDNIRNIALVVTYNTDVEYPTQS